MVHGSRTMVGGQVTPVAVVTIYSSFEKKVFKIKIWV